METENNANSVKLIYFFHTESVNISEFRQADINIRCRHQAKEKTPDTNDAVLKPRVGSLVFLFTMDLRYIIKISVSSETMFLSIIIYSRLR